MIGMVICKCSGLGAPMAAINMTDGNVPAPANVPTAKRLPCPPSAAARTIVCTSSTTGHNKGNAFRTSRNATGVAANTRPRVTTRTGPERSALESALGDSQCRELNSWLKRGPRQLLQIATRTAGNARRINASGNNRNESGTKRARIADSGSATQRLAPERPGSHKMK